jgi:hypothetical protein
LRARRSTIGWLALTVFASESEKVVAPHFGEALELGGGRHSVISVLFGGLLGVLGSRSPSALAT